MAFRRIGWEKWTVLGVALAGAMGLLASSASARTLRSITIDGNLDDWSEVLLDHPQTMADRSLAQGDPDAPGQAQRDLRSVAVTWDATNLYLYFSRTGSGSNAFNAIFYLDIGHDGLLDAADRIVFFKFAGSSFNGFDLHAYAPAAPGGDPIPGDGVPPPGGKGAFLSNAGASGAGDPSGIRFEVALPWTLFTATPQAPLFVRAAMSANQNVPGGIEDNADPIDTFLPDVHLSAGRTLGTAPGRSVDLPHRMTNVGTGTDVLDLSTRSLLGFRVEIHSDPNGDGDPSDGELVAVDANGDGDYTDALDMPPSPAWDTNGDQLPDGGPLAVDASRDWVLRVTVPAGQAVGTEDTVRVSASSDYRSSARAVVRDHVRVGLVTVTPPGTTLATSTFFGRFPHEACNNSGVARTLEVEAVSASGWGVDVATDPNGDGDPADGGPLSDSDGDGSPDLGLVADGVCVPFVVSVMVPPGTPDLSSDTITVTVSDGLVSAFALDVVDTVGSRIALRLDESRTAQRGKTVHVPQHAINAANEVDSFSLGAVSSLGSQTTILDDPDGDGSPSDSAPVAGTGPIAANGGRFDFLTRIRIPVTAVHGDMDTVTAEGVSDLSGLSASATVTIDVAGLLTYSDPMFARPSSEFFGQCGVVYALAFQDSGSYIFTWLDPGNVLRRASAELSPYADGSLDDFFDLGGSPEQGPWTVQLLRKQGSNWIDPGPEGRRVFEVLNLTDAGAAVSEVETGADIYDQFGENFVGYSEVTNPTPADILDSTLSWVVFFDSDGDGRPTAGEDWLQGDGSVAPWTDGAVTASHAGIDVFAGESWLDRFDVAGANFSRIGGWSLWAGWTGSCGYLVSDFVASFTVGCEPEPSFEGLSSAVDLDPCADTGVLLSWPAAANWGVGGGGTYAVWRSEEPDFEPSNANLLAWGLPGLSYLDGSGVVGTTYHYLVQAESDVTCSFGPNNDGLLDGNRRRVSATDGDFGAVPVAAFTHSTPECWDGVQGLVSFQDLSSGPPTEWSWDFDGDGLEDASGPSPSFDFPSAGTWNVRLRVSNVCGEDEVVVPVVLTERPTAVPAAQRLDTCVGEALQFDASASSAVAPASLVAWSWDFDGDGLEDSDEEVPAPWVFSGEGVHDVSLRVSDSEGCTHEQSLSIVVHAELEVALGPPVVDTCTGRVSVTAVATGGLPPYDHDWDVLTDDGSGTGSSIFPPGTEGSATLIVSDSAGCVVVALSGPFSLPAALQVVASAPAVEACTGRVTASALGSGGTPPYTFSWDVLSDDGAGTGSALLPFASSGSAVVTITDAEGCTAQASTSAWAIPEELGADFSPTVVYESAGVFSASATAFFAGGTGPFAIAWDLDDDGSVDSDEVDFSTTMGAGESRPLRLTVSDANGCIASVLGELVSGGCPVDRRLERLMVRKAADGVGLVLSWDESTHECHGRYRLVEAESAVPASRPGTWPSDPQWSDLQAEDADGSDQNAVFELTDPRAGQDRYFLVRDGGTDGSFAPTGHYGNDAVGP